MTVKCVSCRMLSDFGISWKVHAGIEIAPRRPRPSAPRAARTPPQSRLKLAASAPDRGDRGHRHGQRRRAGAEHVAAGRLADDRGDGGAARGAAVRAALARRAPDAARPVARPPRPLGAAATRPGRAGIHRSARGTAGRRLARRGHGAGLRSRRAGADRNPRDWRRRSNSTSRSTAPTCSRATCSPPGSISSSRACPTISTPSCSTR